MIDLITKENSFYALYNEPFGDILKAFLISSPSPALIGMVADAPAPVDKEVTQIAKNVVQFAVQRIEISGVKGDPKQIVADILNEIDRQLKVKKVTNGILCCSVIVIYDHNLYIGGVGDCTIALCNERGSLRFCHDGPNEPRPQGVENITVAPGELMGLSHDARLGDLPEPYSPDSVYQFESDPSLNIYMFSDGLTKHIPDFFVDLPGSKPDDVFARVNLDIPKDTESLLDDICFTVINMPAELAPKVVNYPPKNRLRSMSSSDNAKASPKTKADSKSKKARPPKKKEEPRESGFWVLFMMLLFIMILIVMFGFWAAYEWLSFKDQLLKAIN
ncbi:MAG: hypothetical protein P1U89_09220 [Verrucomicrobiales bacterium]|nr:hypothetical protein [Verrucomicrobiales bacterium]